MCLHRTSAALYQRPEEKAWVSTKIDGFSSDAPLPDPFESGNNAEKGVALSSSDQIGVHLWAMVPNRVLCRPLAETWALARQVSIQNNQF